MAPKLWVVLALVVVLFPLDQASKLWVEHNVSPLAPLEVIDGFFRITHARNPGMALGLLQDVRVEVFILLSLAALALVMSFFRRIPDGDLRSATALGLILAGALGNLVDRLVRGEVVDFLQFNFGLFVFPDFNLADSAIVIGVLLLLLDVLAAEAEPQPAGSGGTEAGREPSP